MRKLKTVVFVSVVFLFAGCEPHGASQSVLPQEAVAVARADPDTLLAEKVERALGTDAGTLPYGVEVTATEGKVELWGTVDSSTTRKQLEVTAAGVVGVKSLTNHLRVDPGA
jgi:osmotically-inducible protein OsmY